MLRSGVLSPAKSAEFIAKSAKHVKLHEDGIETLCDEVSKVNVIVTTKFYNLL